MGGQDLAEDPVFIIGMWRSGTTVCHELVAAMTGWLTPQTWQCFNPSTCFLTSPPSTDHAVHRPMDLGKVTALGPQEDEFALLLLGEPSIYRAFIDPRRMTQCAAELWSPDWSIEVAGQMTRWRQFLRGIGKDVTNAPLLLKSPSHTFRLPFLRQSFPRAKFIWMGRETGELLASNANMWRAMMGIYGLWTCPERCIDSFLSDMMLRCGEVLARCLDEMPQESMLWVDFHDLRTNPALQLQRILRFIGLDEAALGSCFEQRVELALSRVPVHGGSLAGASKDRSLQTLDNLTAAARRRFSS
jgi:hypothetical protein